jgi:dUTP pyrophosphatase
MPRLTWMREKRQIEHEIDPERTGPVYAGPGLAPARTYLTDAGFDLFALNGTNVAAGDYARIPAGVAVEWPPGYWGLLVGRSSSFDRGILVNTGIIDPGFRGELFAVVRNVSQHPVFIEEGERIAQIVPLPAAPVEWGHRLMQVEHLSATSRGENGFGSSGR